MKHRISNQMDGRHMAQQDFAVSIQLMYATQKSVYFYTRGISFPVIVRGQKS